MRANAVRGVPVLLCTMVLIAGFPVMGICGGNTEGGNQGGGNTAIYKETAPTVEGVLTLTQVPDGAPFAGPGPGPAGMAFYSFSGNCNNNKLVSVNTDPANYFTGSLGYVQFSYPTTPPTPKPLALVTEDDLVGYTTDVVPSGCEAGVVYPTGTEPLIVLKTVKSFRKDCTADPNPAFQACRIVANVIFFNLVPR